MDLGTQLAFTRDIAVVSHIVPCLVSVLTKARLALTRDIAVVSHTVPRLCLTKARFPWLRPNPDLGAPISETVSMLICCLRCSCDANVDLSARDGVGKLEAAGD